MELKYAIIGTVALFGGCATLNSISHMDRDTYEVRVVGTERVVDSSGESTSSKYVVFTSDVSTGVERAFENTDSLTECLFSRCKFDSSDLQAKLKKAEKDGTPVRIKAYGWRVPILSSYENIVSVTPLSNQKK